MLGRGLEENGDPKERGVQPRVIDHLFAETKKKQQQESLEYLVKCSFLEIYNESIIDLVRLFHSQEGFVIRWFKQSAQT